MSLADYQGSDRITTEGVQRVKVIEAVNCEVEAGTKGIEFTLENERGKTTRHTIWTTKKSLFRLANFCRECGMTQDEMESYEDNVLLGNQRHTVGKALKGKWLRVEIRRELGKDGNYYHNVVETFVDGEVSTQPMAQRVAEAKPEPASALPADSDIPF